MVFHTVPSVTLWLLNRELLPTALLHSPYVAKTPRYSEHNLKSRCLGRMHLIYVLGHKPNHLRMEAFREVMSHSFNQYKVSTLDLLSCVHTVLGWNERIFRAMKDERRLANGLKTAIR